MVAINLGILRKRFGQLKVLKFLGTQDSRAVFLCKCDCGFYKAIKSNVILTGNSKTCGCRLPKEFVGVKPGKIIGGWTIMGFANTIQKNNQRYWLAKCNKCGEIREMSSHNILRIKTCGCGKFLEAGEGGRKNLFHSYQKRAFQRGLTFELDFDTFVNLTKQNCFYCNSKPGQIVRKDEKNAVFVYNGIDRTDNSIGYTKENCVPACGFCNKSKQNRSFVDFMAWLKQIQKHRNQLDLEHNQFKVGDKIHLTELILERI